MAKETMIADDVRDLIALTADEAASKVFSTYMENITGQVNYYRIIERVLYNYNKLKALVEDEQEYLTVELHEKSKSVVVFSPSGGGSRRSADDIADEVAREKLLNYESTAAKFHVVEKVIEKYQHEKEFVVIRMYYFGKDPDGNPRGAGKPQYTWEEIALELSERNILKDSKTARRWRNKIINDIAFCMFGLQAAVSTGVFRGKGL